MKTRFLGLTRSLRAQMVLSTLVIIVLVQLASFATVTWSWRSFTQNVAVELTVTTLRTLRSALGEVPADGRAAFVQSASDGQWRLWSRDLPAQANMEQIRRHRDRRGRHAQAPRPPHNDIRHRLRSFVEALNQRLDDDDTRVWLSHGPEPKLYISLTGRIARPGDGGQREWLIIPLDRIAPPIATPVILLWLAGMGGFLMLALAFAWHITRPLTRLAQAADQLAAGQPQRVQPSGPTETRRLGERFNAMLDALAESGAVRRTLLAGLPHDLKGPLSRMWLRVEMLDDPDVREGMRKDVQDMQRMVDQFLGFVRGSDPGSYQFDIMDLRPWLQQKVADWQTAGTQISLSGGDGPAVMIRADALSLERLIDNLVTNALHHGKEPIAVYLGTSDGQAMIDIVDHGPGISPECREDALRPFSRLDDARTRTGSVGLGLALAEAIAQAHRGRISLDTAAGGGLKVCIRLPLAEQAA